MLTARKRHLESISRAQTWMVRILQLLVLRWLYPCTVETFMHAPGPLELRISAWSTRGHRVADLQLQVRHRLDSFKLSRDYDCRKCGKWLWATVLVPF